MRINYFKIGMFITVVLVVLAGLQGGAVCAQKNSASVGYREYDVKAAFLFNFIKFTDWPKNKPAEPNKIIIGVLGQDQFGDSFNSVQNKLVRNKKLVIKRYGKFTDLCKNLKDNTANPCANLEDLKKCHLLFICKSETPHLKQILEAVSAGSVLTAGECDKFLDAGGMINFILSENKVAFEINTAAAKDAKIQINSRVLRLAKRIKSD
jgi:hypothetical protein